MSVKASEKLASPKRSKSTSKPKVREPSTLSSKERPVSAGKRRASRSGSSQNEPVTTRHPNPSPIYPSSRSPRVIVVAKRSAFTQFVEEQEDQHIAQLIAEKNSTVRRWRAAHESHQRTLSGLEKALSELGVRSLVLKRSHAIFDAAEADLVVTVGGDGTLLAASHHVARTPMLAINSDPRHSVGFFCAANKSNLKRTLAQALSGQLASIQLSRMEVVVNGRVRSRRVLNEALCCHASPAHTSRYIVHYGRRKEQQRSSGFWIGPAAGSTAAQRSAGGVVLPLSSQALQFVVREAYVSDEQELGLKRFLVEENKALRVQIKMHDAALFLDGPHSCIRLRFGDEVLFRRSQEPITLLGLKAQREAETQAKTLR